MEFDDLPMTPNQLLSRHWRIRHGEKAKWHRRIGLEVFKKKLMPPEPLAKAVLILTRYSSSDLDYDGLVGSFKYCTDALISSGIIKDDKMSVIGMPVFGWVKCKKNEGKITIEVREIECAS